MKQTKITIERDGFPKTSFTVDKNTEEKAIADIMAILDDGKVLTPKGKPFEPQFNNPVWGKDSMSPKCYTVYSSEYIDDYAEHVIGGGKLFKDVLRDTLCFGTEEEASAAVEYDRALLRIKKYIRDNIEGGVWLDYDFTTQKQTKYYILNGLENDNFEVIENPYQVGELSFGDINNVTGYFRTGDDALKVIENCTEDLDIVFNYRD